MNGSLIHRGLVGVLTGTLLMVVGCDRSVRKEAALLNGAGASFPAPLYQQWFRNYKNQKKDVLIHYRSQGSGEGVRQFIAGEVDFGASDAAMNDEEIAKVEKGALMLPMTAGSIVVAYNLPGVQELRLSREAYCDIFIGKITRWNDPKIAETNEGVSLPDQEIQVIHRADDSGTTFVFTQHLSAICDTWKNGPGIGKQIDWPEGNFLGAEGNEGVATKIKQINGSIGYLEYGYAQSHKEISMATLQNRSGRFVKPSLESTQSTLASVKLPEQMRVFITDPEGEKDYPIVTFTWILAYRKYKDAETVQALKKVLKFCLSDSQQAITTRLGYIPLPKDLRERVSRRIEEIQ